MGNARHNTWINAIYRPEGVHECALRMTKYNARTTEYFALCHVPRAGILPNFVQLQQSVPFQQKLFEQKASKPNYDTYQNVTFQNLAQWVRVKFKTYSILTIDRLHGRENCLLDYQICAGSNHLIQNKINIYLLPISFVLSESKSSKLTETCLA